VESIYQAPEDIAQDGPARVLVGTTSPASLMAGERRIDEVRMRLQKEGRL
jgi:hypothetical protein